MSLDVRVPSHKLSPTMSNSTQSSLPESPTRQRRNLDRLLCLLAHKTNLHHHNLHRKRLELLLRRHLAAQISRTRTDDKSAINHPRNHQRRRLPPPATTTLPPPIPTSSNVFSLINTGFHGQQPRAISSALSPATKMVLVCQQTVHVL